MTADAVAAAGVRAGTLEELGPATSATRRARPPALGRAAAAAAAAAEEEEEAPEIWVEGKGWVKV